jgi:molecular chaperone DnaK
MAISIGIDLGTTNSCAAIMDGATPRVITTEEGAASIPSVFAVDEAGQQLVGASALDQAEANPLGTVQATKRLIGRNFHSKSIDQTRQVFTYEMVEGANEEVMVQVRDSVFTLEQISAAILSRIKAVAEVNLGGPVDKAVITVPAYFNERQRASVRTAGQMAGLEVLRILNEPTAAALAYGLGKQLNSRIAVYDLGGGTFDISIIDIKDSVYEVVATGGDTFLGGVDFDDKVMRHILEGFHAEHSIDLSFDRVAVQRIRSAAEAAKIVLSTQMKTQIDLPGIAHAEDGSPIHIRMPLSRAQLEQLTLDLVQRTVDTCRRIFEEAAISPRDVDEILLVGGQSRMPLVQRAVGQMQGRPPNSGLDPELAVGLGAAIMAKAASHPAGADVTLRDVLPIPIGTYSAGGQMHVLFAKNERLPTRRSRTLTTSRDGQRSIMLRIYQGESPLAEDNDLLGTFVFSGIRIAPAGEVQLELSFDLDAEGNLRVSAHDLDDEDRVDSYMKLDPSGRPPPPRSPEKRLLAGRSELGQDDEFLPPTLPPAPLRMPMSSLASNIEGATAPESELNERGEGPGVWTQPTQAEVSWDEDGDEDEGQPLSFWAWLLSPFRR